MMASGSLRSAAREGDGELSGAGIAVLKE